MSTQTKTRFSWSIFALVVILVAGIYSCNNTTEEKKEEPATTAPAPAPSPDTTATPADTSGKAATDTTENGKGGQEPPAKKS